MRIGIDLGGTKIEGIAIDSSGTELSRQRVETPSSYSETVKAIRDLIIRIELEQDQTGTIGIGHPGSVSPTTGLLRNANSTWLNDRPFIHDLEKLLSRPVRSANDADCFALSEARDGAGSGAGIVFGVIIGTGVGGGIVIDGELLAGAQKIAGEWGHNPLPWPSPNELSAPQCWCGQSQCIENWLSGPGMAAEFARETGTQMSAREIFTASATRDAVSVLATQRYVDRLARALSSVINLIDPDIVVLGGGVSNAKGLAQAVQLQLADYVFSDQIQTRIVVNSHGDSSGVRGAAWLWPAQ
jgi:fructokinase